MNEKTTHAARDGRTEGSREAEGLWVELGESEAYWFFVDEASGRRRFVTFRRRNP